MNTEQLEGLLHEDESNSLDFKIAQYPFAGASEEEKSELLKDILAFANSWRRTDAYILIGVEDVQGGRSIVHGVTEHLLEHNIQLFVTKKTNRPVHFSYTVFSIEGKQIGIIKLTQQDRPIYLKRNYGPLENGRVYIRRGSATDIASLDEISKMGSSPHYSDDVGSVSLQFADAETETLIGREVKLTTDIAVFPPSDELPEYNPERSRSPLYNALPSVYHTHYNEKYYREYAYYFQFSSMFQPVRLALSNIGSTPVKNASIVIRKRSDESLLFATKSNIPEKPWRSRNYLAAGVLNHTNLRDSLGHYDAVGEFLIELKNDQYAISVEMENLRPKEVIFSETLLLASYRSAKTELTASVYADNLPDPVKFQLALVFDISISHYTFDDLLSKIEDMAIQ